MRKQKPSHFLKAKSKKQNIINTLKILLTALVAAITAITLFCGIANGWDSVARFFKGSYFCMILVILLIIATIAFWVYSAFEQAKKVTDDED